MKMTKKEKEEIYTKVQANFFNNNIEYTVDELGRELRYFYPIFNILNVKIEENESSKSSKIIKYIDEDIVTSVIDGKTGDIKVLDKPIDMSSEIIKIEINEHGNVLFIENGTCGIITKGNKEFNLFSSYLIGKKIKLI